MYRMTNRTPRSLRALLLDDHDEALLEVRRALEARCFSVLAARDGTRGVELLLEELLELDVLVVDLDLPHRDARAFADLIRRAGGERDLAVVVLAHDATPELRAELRALGVDALVDRSSGPEAAAEAAVAAVAARTGSGGDSAEHPPMAPEESPAAAAPWELSFGRWSLLPA
ncbi:MAG TPA: response regulator [Anaeromyxobacter sp.]